MTVVFNFETPNILNDGCIQFRPLSQDFYWGLSVDKIPNYINILAQNKKETARFDGYKNHLKLREIFDEKIWLN